MKKGGMQGTFLAAKNLFKIDQWDCEGIRTIAPEEGYLLVSVRIWFRVTVRIWVGGNFPWGKLP